MNDDTRDVLSAIRWLTEAKKQRYPCAGCPAADQRTCMCAAWREWFSREWVDIRQSAETLRKAGK